MSSSNTTADVLAGVLDTFSQLAASKVEHAPTDQYGYIPTRYVCFIFVILFGLSTLTHLFQGVYYRLWWTLPTIVLAGCLEVLGWSGRLWSSFSPILGDPFMIQIVCTIIGPTPLVAANFIILSAMIEILGPMYSRLSARNYSRIFLTCDIVSLVVQGAGGGIASGASTHDGAMLGSNIMLGGIIFQLIVIVVYSVLASEFFYRYHSDKPVRASSFRGEMDGKLKIMRLALGFNLVLLFIRAIYRTIELSGGWDGHIIRTEVYFNVLDGVMVVLAIITFNFCHPGYLIGRDMGSSVAKLRKTTSEASSAVELFPRV